MPSEKKHKEYALGFDIGMFLVLKTDQDKLQRICTGITIRQNGICYELTHANTVSWHYDFEIESEKTNNAIGFCK